MGTDHAALPTYFPGTLPVPEGGQENVAEHVVKRLEEGC